MINYSYVDIINYIGIYANIFNYINININPMILISLIININDWIDVQQLCDVVQLQLRELRDLQEWEPPHLAAVEPSGLQGEVARFADKNKDYVVIYI